MKKTVIVLLSLIYLIIFLLSCAGNMKNYTIESNKDIDEQMEWWREARFGMFIHWGLYAIPAGQWGEQINHAEWIRTTAQIPLEEYDKFVDQFNPVKFDAKAWVQVAKDAGMKYIVITSKHHDGFCLFDSKYTDFDVMSTPFKRDILKELSAACHEAGLKMCWYHSIMDWHHPDYLPRREWEKNRSADGADYDRYVKYMKNQLQEIIKNYGEIGVLWFDGEWEGTWTHEHGKDLYHYVRGLQPNIIINNRVDIGRAGMEGLTKEGEYAGDFGTPEQEVPATGLPDTDWESCITMNHHWGFNEIDNNWKSDKELIHMLIDIVSKGGNFLLNVGPTVEGLFPQPSIDRLHVMGKWLKKYGDAVYGTKASPFKKLDWGRCTQKPIKNGTRLYLHVFDWPQNGSIVLPGILNEPQKAFLHANSSNDKLKISREEDAIIIKKLPVNAPNNIVSVIVLDIDGQPQVIEPPIFKYDSHIFTDYLNIEVIPCCDDVDIHYSVDGSIPNDKSLKVSEIIKLTETTTVNARHFVDGKPLSGCTKATFTKVQPKSAVNADNLESGLKFEYYEGKWDQLPEFDELKPIKYGIQIGCDLSNKVEQEYFGFRFKGLIKISETAVYHFYTESDDGSQFFIGDEMVVDNDGLHGMTQQQGTIALSAGLHPITITFFEKTGGDGLKVFYQSRNMKKHEISDNVFFYNK